MQRPGRVRTVRTAERTCAAVCARCSRTNQAPPARRTWSNSETAVDEGGNVRCHELPRLVSSAVARRVHCENRVGCGRSGRIGRLARFRRGSEARGSRSIAVTSEGRPRAASNLFGKPWHCTTQPAVTNQRAPATITATTTAAITQHARSCLDSSITQSLNRSITQSPDYPITKFSACQSFSHTRLPARPPCADRTPERSACTPP
jgi:hypothetical protein